MLVLTRRAGEKIKMVVPPNEDGVEITIEMVRFSRNQCKVGITAPRKVQVIRDDAKVVHA